MTAVEPRQDPAGEIAPPGTSIARVRARRAFKAIGFAVGAALFVAAIVVALRGGGGGGVGGGDAVFATAARAARERPTFVIGALGLPLASWAITSAIFWVLLLPVRRRGVAPSWPAVPFAEMAALIGAAGLLNYLPLKPGLVGRVAYHQKFNRIPAARSIASIITAIACGGAAIALMLLAAASGRAWLLALVPLVPAAALAGCVASPRGRAGGWVVPAAVLLRTFDLLAWVGRYVIAFELVGTPITLMQAAAVAAVSQAALLIPIAGNGLGVREWATALVATSLPAAAGSVAMARHDALSADLLNRAAELVVVVPLGLICIASLARRRRSADRSVVPVQPG